MGWAVGRARIPRGDRSRTHMRFVLECPQCAARFRLRRYEPERRVHCRSCRTIIQVPVVEEYLSPAQRLEYARRSGAVAGEARRKLARLGSLRRLAAVAAALLVLVAAGALLLVVRLRHGWRVAEVKPRPMSLEDLAAARDTSPFPIGRGFEWQYASGDKVETVKVAHLEASGAEAPMCEVNITAPDRSGSEVFRFERHAVLLVRRTTGLELATFEPPLPVLRFPLTSGAQWEYRGRVVRDSKSAEAQMKFEVEVEAVQVPAGRFTCYRVSISGAIGSSEVNERCWYAPGIGLVQRVVGAAGEVVQLTRYPPR